MSEWIGTILRQKIPTFYPHGGDCSLSTLPQWRWKSKWSYSRKPNENLNISSFWRKFLVSSHFRGFPLKRSYRLPKCINLLIATSKLGTADFKWYHKIFHQILVTSDQHWTGIFLGHCRCRSFYRSICYEQTRCRSFYRRVCWIWKPIVLKIGNKRSKTGSE